MEWQIFISLSIIILVLNLLTSNSIPIIICLLFLGLFDYHQISFFCSAFAPPFNYICHFQVPSLFQLQVSSLSGRKGSEKARHLKTRQINKLDRSFSPKRWHVPWESRELFFLFFLSSKWKRQRRTLNGSSHLTFTSFNNHQS